MLEQGDDEHGKEGTCSLSRCILGDDSDVTDTGDVDPFGVVVSFLDGGRVNKRVTTDEMRG